MNMLWWYVAFTLGYALAKIIIDVIEHRKSPKLFDWKGTVVPVIALAAFFFTLAFVFSAIMAAVESAIVTGINANFGQSYTHNFMVNFAYMAPWLAVGFAAWTSHYLLYWTGTLLIGRGDVKS